MTDTTQINQDDPMMRPRYVGIPTFFRTPLCENLEDVDIGIIGVPFDGGVTSRPGARHGPREVRNQSTMVRMINQATGAAPHSVCRVADLGD
ncbi:MAG: guanidinopropionase, partial [Pseudomonadales bacterium]